jgi:transketolase
MQREETGELTVTSQPQGTFAWTDGRCRRPVLPPQARARAPAGAGIARGRREFTGDAGECVSVEHFGASAAYRRLYEESGLTAERIAAAARSSLARTNGSEGRRTS